LLSVDGRFGFWRDIGLCVELIGSLVITSLLRARARVRVRRLGGKCVCKWLDGRVVMCEDTFHACWLPIRTMQGEVKPSRSGFRV
jgi:hypothetical protein